MSYSPLQDKVACVRGLMFAGGFLVYIRKKSSRRISHATIKFLLHEEEKAQIFYLVKDGRSIVQMTS